MKLTDRLALCLLFFPFAAFAFLLLVQPWVPIHDSLHNVMWFHQMLNFMRDSHGWPVWNPTLGWGMSTSLTNLAVLSPSQIFLLPISKVWSGWNAVTLFYVANLLDECLLLVGAWLFSAKLARSVSARVFFCLSIWGGVFWGTQVYWNFRLIYALPFSLFLLADGIDTKSISKFLLGAAVFFFCSAIGDLLYCGALLALPASAFLAVYALPWSSRFAKISALRRPSVLLLALVVVLVAAVPGAILAQGLTPAFTGPGRGSDGQTTYNTFLDHGNGFQSKTLLRVADPFHLGVDASMGSDQLNIATYGGVFLIPFLIVGLLFGRGQLFRAALSAFVLALTIFLAKGLLVAPIFFYVPLLSKFRHFGFLVPLLKFFLVCIAAIGWDAMVTEFAKADKRMRSRIIGPILIGCFFSAVLLFIFYGEHAGVTPLANQRLYIQIVAIVGLATVMLRQLWSRQAQGSQTISILALALVALDLFGYRSTLYHTFMVPVSREVWNLFGARMVPFAPERIANVETLDAFKSLRQQVLSRAGESYNVIEPFVGADVCKTLFRTDTLSPFASPLYGRFKPDALTARDFASGCGAPKLRLSPAVTVLPREIDVLVALDGKPTDTLFVAEPEWQRYLRAGGLEAKGIPVGGSVKLTDFKADKLEAETRVKGAAPHWLYYADTWHPSWIATVNGKPAEILRTNFGFKAIAIPAGLARVSFSYEAPIENYLWTWMWFLSLGLWVVFAFSLTLCVKVSSDEHSPVPEFGSDGLSANFPGNVSVSN